MLFSSTLNKFVENFCFPYCWWEKRNVFILATTVKTYLESVNFNTGDTVKVGILSFS